MTKEEFIERVDTEISAVMDEMEQKSSFSPEYSTAIANLVTLHKLKADAENDILPKEVEQASKDDESFLKKFFSALATPQVLCAIATGLFSTYQFSKIMHWESTGKVFHLREAMSRIRRP